LNFNLFIIKPNKLLLGYGKSKLFAEQVVLEFLEERKKLNLPCFEVAVGLIEF
jgi:hypothetical protein